MSKAVLLSIKPKYCELIASGKKTVEVRKTKPKLDTPFKCYIYCTKDFYRAGDGYFKGNYCGKLIAAELVCKSILPISINYSDPNSKIALRKFPFTCLTDKEIMDYLGNGNIGYGLCISDLVIYDKPKELSEFEKPHEYIYQSYRKQNSFFKGITRPPQSWGYVEELI